MMYRSCGVLWAATSAAVKVLDMARSGVGVYPCKSLKDDKQIDTSKKIMADSKVRKIQVVVGERKWGGRRRCRGRGSEGELERVSPFMNPHHQNSPTSPPARRAITCRVPHGPHGAARPIWVCRDRHVPPYRKTPHSVPSPGHHLTHVRQLPGVITGPPIGPPLSHITCCAYR